MTDAIITHDLTKTYGSARGIRDVNLAVHKGEIFGFLGPNGAGKSTTLRTIMGFMTPTSGRVEILGIDPHQHPIDALAHVGNLPTEFSLDPRMTGREMLRYFGDLRGLRNISFADTIARRIDADLDRPMRKLSRGNKQKIGIVQALFHKPDVIILDEPTGGLDPLVQEAVLHILQEARDNGQTIFFSSHVLAEVERIADRVGIIRDGELVAVERPHDLTSRALRHVRIRFVNPPSPDDIRAYERIPGVTHLIANGQDLTFSCQGDIDRIIKLTALHDVSAVDIERPSLEEIFLSFYGQGEGEGRP